MNVHPFHALSYTPHDLSALVAPPYDVLNAAQKQDLLARNPDNIVAVDLPHVPPKELGPPAAYDAAASRLRELIARGTLAHLRQPVMFAYRQTFASGSRTIQRTGMACTIDLVAFGPRDGGGVLPHEETFSGPKEDRMALMKATRTQLSPIFGLHPDVGGKANALLQRVTSSRKPDHAATTADGTLHETWTISDHATIEQYQHALNGEDVFIADGHHRYTTALNYLKSLVSENGGRIASDHPASRCMIVLVGMSDPGLIIWPTHRVLGGMTDYSFEKFAKAAENLLLIRQVGQGLDALGRLEREMTDTTLPPRQGPSGRMARNVLGLFDFSTQRCLTATLIHPDPLAKSHPGKPAAWRELDVAIIQHAIVEGVCQPALNRGQSVKWAFPHTIHEIVHMAEGSHADAGESPHSNAASFAQLAIIVRPTPLEAVRDISRANVLMPQKSTFFYPKLATGLFMHAVDA